MLATNADIIVVGGGVSGCAAAIAAARGGARVLVIERHGFLGGSATASLVGPWMTFHSANGSAVIAGVAQEIVDRLVKLEASPGHVRDPLGVVYSVTPFDPSRLTMVLENLFTECGIDVIFNSVVLDMHSSNGRITDIVVGGKSGTIPLRAPLYIDSTGDGDVAAAAGADFEVGRPSDGLCQPMTMIFTMSGVETQEVIDYMVENPGEFHETTDFDLLARNHFISASGFYSLWEAGVKAGELHIPRDRILFFSGVRPGEVLINTTRVVNRNPLDPKDVSLAEREGRRQVWELASFLRKRVPGFANAYVADIASNIGIRESRRIMGEYVLTEADVIGNARFDDVIARGSYPIDIHDPSGSGLRYDSKAPESYDIPYRCLLPRGLENLLVAGRCISATHEALGSARVSPICMATGQAAGTAAALAARMKASPREVSCKALQDELVKNGAILS